MFRVNNKRLNLSVFTFVGFSGLLLYFVYIEQILRGFYVIHLMNIYLTSVSLSKSRGRVILLRSVCSITFISVYFNIKQQKTKMNKLVY